MAPDNTIVPAPALVIPAALLMTPLIVKSAAAVKSSAIVNVLLALKETGHEMVAPSVPPVLSVTVTLPPKVNVDDPETIPPVTAQPPSNETAFAVTACANANSSSDLTVSEAIVKARPVVVLPPETIRFLNVVNIDAGNVFVVVSSTVPAPVPGVQTFVPVFPNASALQINFPPAVITMDPRWLVFAALPKVTVPETVSWEEAAKVKIAVALLVPRETDLQTAFVTFTVILLFA